jgi:hypothetical protein
MTGRVFLLLYVEFPAEAIRGGERAPSKEKAPAGGGLSDQRRTIPYFLVSVEVVEVVVVVVPMLPGIAEVPVVEVMVVPVISVPVPIMVEVEVVPVSCTTAGCSLVVVVVVSVSSFFLQPAASATPRTATRPRVTNFFISLISFF